LYSSPGKKSAILNDLSARRRPSDMTRGRLTPLSPIRWSVSLGWGLLGGRGATGEARFVTLFYLDKGIRSAKWLTANEKQVLEAAIADDHLCKTSSPVRTSDVLRDGRVWLMCLIYFCFVLGLYGLTFWMPRL
jgi:hypothetical protein